MDKFNPRHFVFLVLATGIVALKTYPLVFISDIGKDSWVAVVISSVIIALYFMFSIQTLKLVKGHDFVTIYRIALGKPLGTIMIIFFVFTILLTLVECTTIQADGMHQNMMIETPNWYFIIFFTLTALYIIRKDLVAIILVIIICISLIMLAGIHLGIMTMKQKEFLMLLPVMQDGITKDFVIAVLKSLGMYGFITITLPYLETIDDSKISLKKYGLIALAILIQMQIVSITGIFSTFSVKQAEAYYYPKLIQTHLVSYMQIMEFGELYVMLQMLVGWMLKYLVAFYSLILIFKFFKFKNKNIVIITYIISGAVLIASVLITSTSIRLFNIINYCNPFFCFCYLSITNKEAKCADQTELVKIIAEIV